MHDGSRRRMLGASAGAAALLAGGRILATDTLQSHPVTAGGALRLDFRHTSGSGGESFQCLRLTLERFFGRRRPYIDGLGWGDYRFSARDLRDGTLLHREGFDSPADGGGATSAELSIRLPVPARRAQVAIEKRRGPGAYVGVWSDTLDLAQQPAGASGTLPVRTHAIVANGDPVRKVDVAMLGDGYTADEYPKLVADAARAADYLFSVEPFRRRVNDFNVHAVFASSAERGVTDAYLGAARTTVLDCAYLGGTHERTLVARSNRRVRDVAAAVPYDYLLVLANSRRYGGSAFFGGPAVVAIDAAFAKYLVLHEFAHAIAGLADEYYIPDREGPAYRGNVEPWHPNVTISLDEPKWKHLLAESRRRPTAWNKAAYDAYFAGYVRRYHGLRDRRAPEDAVEAAMRDAAQRQASLLGSPGGTRRVGLFEGAHGYSRGAFRSEADCIMFSLQTRHFCAACASAIERAIDQHCT
jgi:hypothetical protein